MHTLDHAQVLSLLPDRDPFAHKGCFGKILLLCGSRGYTGAAALAAMGALRSGAGLTYLGVPESIYAIEAVKLTEPVVFPVPEEKGMLCAESVPEILKMLPGISAVLFGCGSGKSEGTFSVLKALMEHYTGALILDADGINLLEGHIDLLRNRRHTTILTPHDGEFTRIAGDIGRNRQEKAMAFARENGCILLLKGHRTIITDGIQCYRNETGNPGMAVGGSGDVLAGIITSLVGQKLEPLEAAACAAWLHGAAGDLCAEKMGTYGLLPTDMVQMLPQLMK